VLASLFHLKSLGCCGCISTLVILAIAGVLLLAVLGIVFPDLIVPDGPLPDVVPIDALCGHLPWDIDLCATPAP